MRNGQFLRSETASAFRNWKTEEHESTKNINKNTGQ